MTDIHSNVTELPVNCHRTAERMAQAIREEERFADLPETCRQRLTDLEQIISKETGEKVALVAYRM